MKRIVAAGALLVVLISAGQATAQTDSLQAAKSKMSEEKRALITELATVTKIGEMATKSLDMMLDQFAFQAPATLSQMVGDPGNLSGKDKEEFDKAVQESSLRVLRRLRQLLPERINISSITEQVFFPIYDKYFTEQDLKDLIAFYKTPTGQKSIEVMPDVLRESLEKTAELMNSKMTELIRQVLEEEKQRLINR